MKHLIFSLLALSQQLWAANNNVIDIKKLENQRAFIGQINQCMNSNQLDEFIKKANQNMQECLRSSLNITLLALLRALIN
jgi:hypothetical protein